MLCLQMSVWNCQGFKKQKCWKQSGYAVTAVIKAELTFQGNDLQVIKLIILTPFLSLEMLPWFVVDFQHLYFFCFLFAMGLWGDGIVTGRKTHQRI